MWMQLKIKTTNESAVCRLRGFSMQIKMQSELQTNIAICDKFRQIAKP